MASIASAVARRTIQRHLVCVALATTGALAASAWCDGGLSAQPSLVVVRAVERTTDRGLPNAEVIELASGTHHFTNAQGEARLVWPPGVPLRLRVRQLGFRLVERTIERRADLPVPDTITVALERVPFVLAALVTTATDRCHKEPDSISKALSVPALEHIRLGAERYEAFRRAYPFRVRIERRTIRLGPDGKPAQVRRVNETARSEEWGEPYRPDRIVDRTHVGFSVPILFLAALADASFWERHCFVVRGVESLAGRRVLRLEFTPARGAQGADWAGAAFTDSATSLLHRLEFQLVGLRPGDIPRRLEGYTTFTYPSPFIAVPESTAAAWWRREPTPNGVWGMPDVVQLLYARAYEYRKAKPPAP